MTVLDLYDFLRMVTSGKNITEIPLALADLTVCYASIKDEVRRNGKQIMDIAEIGKKYASSFPDISPDIFYKVIGELAMYEAMVNRSEWPEFWSESEKKTFLSKQIIASSNVSPEEKSFFNEAYLTLGDASVAKDIAGEASYQLVPMKERPITKHQKNRQR